MLAPISSAVSPPLSSMNPVREHPSSADALSAPLAIDPPRAAGAPKRMMGPITVRSWRSPCPMAPGARSPQSPAGHPPAGMSRARRGERGVTSEVKTRNPAGAGPRDPDAPEPISVYLTLRKFGAVSDTAELPQLLARLSKVGEDLVEHRVVPGLIVPLREAIAAGNG